MKLNFSIEVDNDTEYIQDQIIDRAADSFIDCYVGYGSSDNDPDDLRTKWEYKIQQKIDKIFNIDFKNQVSQIVIEKLAERYERSQAFKDLIREEKILNSTEIRSQLKELVHELVKSEMKKVFNQ